MRAGEAESMRESGIDHAQEKLEGDQGRGRGQCCNCHFVEGRRQSPRRPAGNAHPNPVEKATRDPPARGPCVGIRRRRARDRRSLQCRVVHRHPGSRSIACRRGFRARIGRRKACLDVWLAKEARVEELERPQQIRVFPTNDIRLVDRHGSIVFRPLGIRSISLDQAARAHSLLVSYLHANDLRFWIAVKTTFAVVSFRKRTTRTLLSPMSVP